MSDDLYSRPLPMGEFFDRVVEQYDEVHTSHIDRGGEFYVAIAEPVLPTADPINVLSLGAGTGLDLVGIVARAPNAVLHCIDVAPMMLDRLAERFRASTATVINYCESYLEFDFADGTYNYILAAATLHHFTDEEKQAFYPRLVRALADGGKLIIGDFFVSDEHRRLFRAYYDRLGEQGYELRSGAYHVDIPTTQAREVELLTAAGFGHVMETWASDNYSILVVMK